MEDDENDFQTNLEEKDVSDLVPAMPNDYYEKFEMFLFPSLENWGKSWLK